MRWDKEVGKKGGGGLISGFRGKKSVVKSSNHIY